MIPKKHKNCNHKELCAEQLVCFEEGLCLWQLRDIYMLDRECLSMKDCRLCSTGEVEDEKHFLIRYTLYHDIRYKIFLNAKNYIENFNVLDFDNKY